MPGFWGLQPEEMQRFSVLLDQSVSELTSLTTELDGLTADVEWEGPDADQFRGQTWPTIREGMRTASTTLQQASEDVRRQLTQQQTASAT